MTEATGTSHDVHAMIEELARNSAELSRLLHETVTLLAELLVEGPIALDERSDQPDSAAPAPLGHDILEIATLQAQAAGLSVEDYLHEAILAYAGRGAWLRDSEGDLLATARSPQRRQDA